MQVQKCRQDLSQNKQNVWKLFSVTRFILKDRSYIWLVLTSYQIAKQNFMLKFINMMFDLKNLSQVHELVAIDGHLLLEALLLCLEHTNIVLA